MNELQQKIYNRFVKYVSLDTTSDPASESVPTTAAQLEFAKTLEAELKALGAQNVQRNEYGFVTAEIPANTDQKAPAVGFLAHMDTVCDYCGKNIKPQIHSNYDGGTLTINAEKQMFLTPQSAPSLKKCIGHDIITADGNTLLGGDDKIGVAAIMTLVEYLAAHPEVKHGPVKIAFTIDEETGTGIGYFDVDNFKADAAYTIDGSLLGEIDCGNFNADKAEIHITGKNCHPGAAKGFMANPVRIAADIVSSWPENKLPETTEGEEGFILFKGFKADLEQADLSAIVREHNLEKFEQLKQELSALVEEKRKKYPGAQIALKFIKQYRNMKDILIEKPLAMNLLEASLKKEEVDYHLSQARGGTDGAQLTFKGLPTPNIFAGYENPHGPYEWVSMQWVETAFRVMLGILREAVK